MGRMGELGAIRPSGARRAHPGRTIWLIAAVATLLYTLIAIGGLQYQRFGMDLGIFDQALQAYSRGLPPYIPIKAQVPFNILGDHFSPIIILLAPLYRLFPSALTLMLAQAFLVGASVGIVGAYARKRGLGAAAYAIEAGFALSYGVLSAVTFDFHEIAFGLPLLLWALWALLDRHTVQLILACAALCLVKEDMPLYIAGIALVLFFTGRRLFGLILGAASVAVTLLLVLVIIPAFSYWGHYTYIGTGARGLQSAGGMALALLSHLVSWQGITFLLTILFTAGLGLRSTVMLVMLPTVVFRFMAHDSVYLGFHFQYGVLLAAVAFVALIDAWGRYEGWRGRTAAYWQRWQKRLLVAGAVMGLALSESFMPVYGLVGAGQMTADRTAAAAAIPDGANVAADVYLVDTIVDRTVVQVAYPSWTDETGAPIESPWVLLDLETRGYHNRQAPWAEALLTRLTTDEGYQVVERVGRYVVLHRE